MKKNNRVLYEKIMRSVSKEVKKALNEYGDTPEGQRRLARLQHRNIGQKINKWHEEHPDEFTPSDEEKNAAGWWDIEHYAMKQSKGKDYLRRAYNDEMGSLLFPDSHKTPVRDRNNPHDVDIDVDSLYDDLEEFIQEKQNKGFDIHIMSGFIDGITIIGNRNDEPIHDIFKQVYNICQSYGVQKDAIDRNYINNDSGKPTDWYEIHINVAFHDKSTNDEIIRKSRRGDIDWFNNFSEMMS